MSDDFAATKPPFLLRRGAGIPAAVSKLLGLFLGRVSAGQLVLELPSGERVEHRGAEPGPEATLVVKSWRMLRRMASRGDVGFAEAYIEGDWTSPDLVSLFKWAHRNEDGLRPAWNGNVIGRSMDRVMHLVRANTRRGSRRNIAAHYDLGNSFYREWLDSGMSYSSALYSDPDFTLEEAQQAKIERIMELLETQAGQSVLEIGCGWGALAEQLAVSKGCRLTGLTLSREQLDYAAKRLDAAGAVPDNAILLQDYRDTTGKFDRIVSIEMIEAAGEDYWPAYFSKIRECLKPGGIAVLQAITIEEKRFASYRLRPDFIQRYIFPGGMLPTVGIIRDCVEREGMRLDHVELFGQSYATTLAAWRERFLRAWPRIRGQRVAEEHFKRMWDYYLAYCEVGFRNGALDVGLYRIVRT